MVTTISIIFYLVGLIIFYIVIETAVRRGINSSIISKALEEKIGNGDSKKKSFFDDDLDDER